MSRTEPLPHLLTIEQLADHLGVTVRQLRRQIAERRVPYIKVGRLVRFDPPRSRAGSTGLVTGRVPRPRAGGR